MNVVDTIFSALSVQEAGTFSLRDGRPARDGFAYCPDTRPVWEADSVTRADVAAAVAACPECDYLGTWRHPRGPLVFLRTVVVTDADDAESACRATSQLAYYDLARGREIPVTY